jgi:hypothetical protein
VDSGDGRSGRRCPLGPVEARYIGHFIGGRDAIQSTVQVELKLCNSMARRGGRDGCRWDANIEDSLHRCISAPALLVPGCHRRDSTVSCPADQTRLLARGGPPFLTDSSLPVRK